MYNISHCFFKLTPQMCASTNKPDLCSCAYINVMHNCTRNRTDMLTKHTVDHVVRKQLANIGGKHLILHFYNVFPIALHLQ